MKTLIDGYDIAEKQNISVYSYDLEGLPSASVMSDKGKCGIAIDNKLLEDETDEKIKLFHELGHCETGSFYAEYCPPINRIKCEKRAEVWSIKELVPYGELMRLVSSGIVEHWELSVEFGVTDEFMCQAMEYYKAQVRIHRG